MTRTDDDPQTNRRRYMKTVGALGAAGMVGLSGCSGGDGGSAATGTLATRVTDQPGDIADFESCVVTIQGFWVKPATDDENADATETSGDNESEAVEQQDTADVDQSDAREYHEFDEPQEADLVQLQDGNTDLVDERDLTAQTYEYLQLEVSGVEGVLADGGEARVGTPGEAPLQFNEAFEVRENTRTTFVGDFTPVKRGQTNRYVLQPVAAGIEVRYDAIETESSSNSTDGDSGSSA